MLQNVADLYGKDVSVTSGDRRSVPSEGSKTSHHLAHRAADFHGTGETDASVFATSTAGERVHVGRYATGAGVSFWTEGLTKETSGKYTKK